MCPTLHELGLTPSGDSLVGNREGIVLSEAGAMRCSRYFVPYFKPGDDVAVEEELIPEDLAGPPAVRIVVYDRDGRASHGIANVNKDDWFQRSENPNAPKE